MKITKYFCAMIAAGGMSLGTLALAQEAGFGDPVNSRCNIAAASIQHDQSLEAVNVDNDSPTEAFCVGLQSHSDGGVWFRSGFSLYDYASSKRIMAKNISIDGGGHGNDRCQPNTGFVEVCVHDQNQALKLDATTYPHPDYLSGSPRYVGPWATVNLASGDHSVVTVANYGKMKLYSGNTYNIKKLVVGLHGAVHLTPGDYFIETLEMDDYSKIIVDGSGTARLFLKNSPTIDEWTLINWLNDPSELVIIADSHFATNLHSSISAYVYSSGLVSLGGWSVLEGAVNAQYVWLSNYSTVKEKLGTIANVDFGEIKAEPADWNYSPLVYGADTGRHSGYYGLTYPIAEAEHYSQADRHVDSESYGELATIVNDIWDEYLDPEQYLSAELLADAIEAGVVIPAVESDEMAIGHIYGVISISVNGWTVFPLLVDIPINLDVPSLLSEEDISAGKGGNITKIEDDHNEDYNYVTFTYASGDPESLNGVYTQEEFDAEEVGAIDVIYGHNILAEGFDSPEERDAAVDESEAGQIGQINGIYAGIIAQWNAARNLTMPSGVEFSTWYPDSDSSFGLSARGYNNDTNWIGVMNDNYYAGLPIVFPLSLLPVVGVVPIGTALVPVGAWCGAWVAAFEVGCFQPVEGESDDYVEGVPSNECEARLEEGAGPVPVNTALQTFAGANLTCGVFAATAAITATVGFGVETHSVSAIEQN